MICSACGTHNEPGSKFCRECGTGLAVECPRCGSVSTPGSKFCSTCGAELGAPISAPAPAPTGGPVDQGERLGPPGAPSGERRLVSIVFADLVGFTGLAEDRDPEETRELLTGYFDTARRVVERYGGTIEKFIGDAVMAVWGTPVAHEDDAERAVRAALELVDAVSVMAAPGDGAPLEARAGVLSGEAAVSIDGGDQAIVAGDLVNTAARLQGVAPAGTVLVGESTRRATESAIEYEAAGEQLLKGKQAPVGAHRALRVVARVGGVGRSERLEPPFVGRELELRLLKDVFHKVGEERRPRLVSITGQAGIGKSRLAWELLKYLDGVTEIAYWHHGRCPAYGEGLSYWALAEMVRSRAGIVDGDATETALRRVHEMLEQFVPDEAERRWIEPGLRRLLDLGGSEEAAGEGDTSTAALFAAWRTLFERISSKGTAVLVFEDLHWADEGLLDFIEHVMEWSRSHPIYVVCLARPELLERRTGWAAARANTTAMGLEPLPERAMRDLLEGLVPGLPAEAMERILQRAEGIPLYAVETVRMLLARGEIEAVDGGYRPAGDLRAIAMPETLQALVASRLDALDGSLRTLLGEASVLGKTFSTDALAATGGHASADELARPLRELVRRELLVIDVDPRSPEQGQYGFVQSVIREVAYERLARDDRRRLHLAAARHLESLGDDEIAGVLAGHYLDAYRARPDGPQGEAVAGQARLALRAAASRAERVGANDLAARHYEQALEVAQTDADRAELHFLAGRSATWAAHGEQGAPHLDRAIELSRALGDRSAVLRATAFRTYAFITSGEAVDAVPQLEAAAEEFADLADDPGYVHLAEALARIYMRTGAHAKSLEWCERGLPAAERHGMTRVVLDLIITRGTVLAAEGRRLEAVATLRGARVVAADRGLPDLEARACINLAFALANDDQVGGMLASREGVELAYRFGLRSYLPYLLGNYAENARGIGEWDGIEELITPALSLDLGRSNMAQLMGSLAMLHAHRGQPYEEEQRAAIADTGPGDPQALAGMEAGLAEHALIEGRFDEAYERNEKAMDIFPEAVEPWSELLAGRAGLWDGNASRARAQVARLEGKQGRLVDAIRAELEAGIAALEGRHDEALQGFALADRSFGDAQLRVERACAQITRLATLGPDAPGSAEAEADAVVELERLGAVRLLERLAAAKARHSPTRHGTPEPVAER